MKDREGWREGEEEGGEKREENRMEQDRRRREEEKAGMISSQLSIVAMCIYMYCISSHMQIHLPYKDLYLL